MNSKANQTESPTARLQSWSIVILCYNEEHSILNVIRKSKSVLECISPQRSEIIVVDDGSTDKSSKILEALPPGFEKVKVIRHSRNLGIGKSLRDGYAAATCENVCMVAGDGQFDVEELTPYASFDDGTFICFYRTARYGSFFRNFVSGVNRILNSRVLG